MTIIEFVTEKHKGQTRKYTEEPYINHLIRIASNFEKDSYLYNLALLSGFNLVADWEFEIELINFLKVIYEDEILISNYISDIKNCKNHWEFRCNRNLSEKEILYYFDLVAKTSTSACHNIRLATILDESDNSIEYCNKLYFNIDYFRKANIEIIYKAIVKHNEIMKLL